MSLRPGLGGAAILILFLAGCGRPEVAACEQFIKSQIVSPASYQRASVETMDRDVSADEYYKAAGRQIETLPQRSRELAQEERYVIRSVVIDYDTADIDGSVVRSKDICQFRMRDGGPDIPNMDLAIGQHEIRRSAVALVGPPIVKPETPCCLS